MALHYEDRCSSNDITNIKQKKNNDNQTEQVKHKNSTINIGLVIIIITTLYYYY